jgi:hypothetical protein
MMASEGDFISLSYQSFSLLQQYHYQLAVVYLTAGRYFIYIFQG